MAAAATGGKAGQIKAGQIKAGLIKAGLIKAGLIEIDLACGARLRVDSCVDERALRRVLSVLQGKRPVKAAWV